MAINYFYMDFYENIIDEAHKVTLVVAGYTDEVYGKYQFKVPGTDLYCYAQSWQTLSACPYAVPNRATNLRERYGNRNTNLTTRLYFYGKTSTYIELVWSSSKRNMAINWYVNNALVWGYSLEWNDMWRERDALYMVIDRVVDGQYSDNSHFTFYQLYDVHAQPQVSNSDVYVEGVMTCHCITIGKQYGLPDYTQLLVKNLIGKEPEEITRYNITYPIEGQPNYDNTSDVIDIPTLPTINIGQFLHLYVVNDTILNSFKSYLFSSDFWDIIKNWFEKPLDSVVALNVAPFSESELVTNNESMRVGTHTLDNVTPAKRVSSYFIEVDCGTVDISEYYGNFADWEGTSVQIYIPFVGFISVKTVDVLSGRLSLKYHINVITGAFTCYLRVIRDYMDVDLDAILYESSGNMYTQLPMTSADYSRVITSVANTIVAGANAVANPTSLVATIPNLMGQYLNSGGTIQRSGTFNKESSLTTMRVPFVLIERPRIAIPKTLQSQKGFQANFSAKLGELSGYTEVNHINLDNIKCTENERTELERLLKAGIIL